MSGETPSLESVRELRLLVLLHDLVKEHGRVKAAEELGVDRKALWRSMTSGRLVPRLASALEDNVIRHDTDAGVVLRQGGGGAVILLDCGEDAEPRIR